MSPRKWRQLRTSSGKMPTGAPQVPQSGTGSSSSSEIVGGGDGGEGDLEGLGVDHAQVRERGLHLVAGGLGQAVGALAGGGVQAGVGFTGGVGNDGGHGFLQVLLVGV